MTDAVLTTGANSGIGLASVLELARRGFDTVGSVRSDAKAEVVAKAAADAGVAVRTVLLDVTDADACTAVMASLELYGLVNNAGYGVTGAIEDIDDDEARALMETMVVAPMRLARLALPAMRRQGTGRIVNVSSIAGIATAPLMGWYTAAKHALEALSDALRMEVAGSGIAVVLVEPGGFKTGIWEEAEASAARRTGSRFDAAYKRTLQGMTLFEPVMGDPDGAARVVANAVASSRPRARYLVGLDAHALALTQAAVPTPIRDRVTRLMLGI